MSSKQTEDKITKWRILNFPKRIFKKLAHVYAVVFRFICRPVLTEITKQNERNKSMLREIENQNKLNASILREIKKQNELCSSSLASIAKQSEQLIMNTNDAVQRSIFNLRLQFEKRNDLLNYPAIITKGTELQTLYEEDPYALVLSATEVYRTIFSVIEPGSIIEIGCGIGAWLYAAKSLHVPEVCGVDRADVNADALMFDKSAFIVHDLEKPFRAKKKYDLVISLEVASTIDKQYAEIFVATLCHSADIVLFSSAHVGQYEKGHSNEQSYDYWNRQFYKHGYRCLDIRPLFSQNMHVVDCYKQNMALYIKSTATYLDVVKRLSLPPISFAACHSMLRIGNDKPALISYLLDVIDNSEQCRRVDNRVWLMLMMLLLEAKMEDRTKQILSRYIELHHYKDIYKSLPVSFFVWENNIIKDDPLVKKAAYAYAVLEKNRRENVFEEYIKGKTIAVVGSAGNEIGKGKGKLIDEHDIVIRFNSYVTDGFEADYGAKTNVWARADAVPPTEWKKRNEVDIIIWEPDWKSYILSNKDSLDNLYDDVIQCGEKIIYLDLQCKKSLRDASNVIFPSTGLEVVWKIYSARGSLENVDLYGFSFLNREKSYDKGKNHGHYFEEVKVEIFTHFMLAEFELLDSIYHK